MKSLFSVLLAIAAIAGCENSARQVDNGAAQKPVANREITVLAAASTTNALEEIKAAFEKSTGTKVRTSYAASSTLARQIENGAEADLFISADRQWADYVASKVSVASRRDLLGNRLVVVAPADSTIAPADVSVLIADAVRHVALGNPDAVPAGRYAKQALIKLDLWEKLKDKIAAAEDVRQALAYVETGAAEAGIVYATDAAISKKVKVIAEIPPEACEPIRYPVLLIKREADGSAAAAFYDCLGTSASAKVFEKYGFVVLDRP
jgi:molybdate transport system substrate-binding protein